MIKLFKSEVKGLTERHARQQEDVKNALLNVMADLREVSVMNEAILASITDGVVVINKSGLITSMNHSAEELLGWKVAESIGKKWFQTLKLEDEKGNSIPPEEEAIGDILINKITTNSSTSGAYYYVRKDGTRFPVSGNISPIVLGEKIVGVVDVFRDITHEREIDKMKTDFVSLASHQLRTPLTAIKWRLETISGKEVGKLTKEQEDCIKDIYQSNETMIKLVNSLLNISRIESGRLNINPEVTDLASLFRSTVAKLRTQIGQADLKLVDKIPKGLFEIKIDPAHIVEHVIDRFSVTKIGLPIKEFSIRIIP